MAHRDIGEGVDPGADRLVPEDDGEKREDSDTQTQGGLDESRDGDPEAGHPVERIVGVEHGTRSLKEALDLRHGAKGPAGGIVGEGGGADSWARDGGV